MTIDSLLLANVVTADGTSMDIHCDEHKNQDVFWAIRGGKLLLPFLVCRLYIRRLFGGIFTYPADLCLFASKQEVGTLESSPTLSSSFTMSTTDISD
jgi:hypothetical protein